MEFRFDNNNLTTIIFFKFMFAILATTAICHIQLGNVNQRFDVISGSGLQTWFTNALLTS